MQEPCGWGRSRVNQLVLMGELAKWINNERPWSEPLIEHLSGRKSCPSYPENPASTQFAVRHDDGTFYFLWPGSELDGQSSLRSVRSFGPCVTTKCHYWAGSCQLGVKLSQIAKKHDQTAWHNIVIDECPIKETCRWRSENGISACQSCVHVNYELSHA